MGVRWLVAVSAVGLLGGGTRCGGGAGDGDGDTVAEVADAIDDGDAAVDTTAPDAVRPEITLASYPRVDGSTSNIPLARVIACELLGVPYGYGVPPGESQQFELTILPYGRTDDERALAQGITTHVVHHRTDQAYSRLIQGEVDLILVASPPSPDELAQAAATGVTLEWEEIALDALVFMVGADSPVTGLTTAQIQGIYTGAITRWAELGGADVAVHPYTRPQNSGSQQLMEALLMSGLTMPEWPPDLVPTFMGGLVEALKEDPAGVGFSVYYYVTHQYAIDGLALIAVDGQLPSPATLAARTYPLVAPVLAVVRSDLDHESVAWRMRAWLLSPDGQRVVAASGYVPILPVEPTTAPSLDGPVCSAEAVVVGTPCDPWSSSSGSCDALHECVAACDDTLAWAGVCVPSWRTDPPELGEPCWGGCAQGLACAAGRARRCRPICDPWAGPADAGRCPDGQSCFRIDITNYAYDVGDAVASWLSLGSTGFCATSHVVGAWDCPRGQWCHPRERLPNGRWSCDCVP